MAASAHTVGFKLTVAVLVVSLLHACAGVDPVQDVERVFTGVPTEETPGMSAEQLELNRLAAESEMIRGQGLLGGAAAGGVIAALVCDDLLCGAGVTVLGATLGYGAGIYLAQKKEDAEAEQNSINSSIDGAQASLSFYEKRANTAAQVVERNRQRITELNQSALESEAARETYKQEYSNMLDDRARISGMSSQLDADIRFMEAEIEARNTYQNEDTSGLEAKKVALEKINKRMREQLAEMDAELERVPDEIKGA